MTLLRLRPYQLETIKALHERWDAGSQRSAAVLPTGAGKTVIFSHLADQEVAATIVQHGRRKKVLILAHRGELLEQAKKKLKSIAPHLTVGIVAAGRDEVGADVIIASEPTLRNPRRRDRIRNVGLIIVDECHHVAEGNKYHEILTHFGAFDLQSGVKVAGFTATLVRGDNAHLGAIWQEVAFKRDISFMVRSRYLIRPKGKRIEVDDLDLRKVKKSGGDFQDAALGEALEASLAPAATAAAYRDHAAGRSGILFAPTVSAAHTFADALNAVGVKTEVVTGSTPAAERTAILDRLENGTTQVVANCMVLTEGFDCPKVSCVVIARPTRASGLYQQMVGRGLRVDPELEWEDQDCLILDVVGASADKTLRTLADLSEKRIEVRDDEYLTDLEDEAEERLPGAGRTILHEADLVEFDPLGSQWVWLKTNKSGTYYITAGSGQNAVYVFLVHTGADSYDVMWATTGSNGDRRGGVTEHVGVPLAVGQAWADQMADQHCEAVGVAEYGYGRRRRDRRQDPTEAQKQKLANFGISLPPGASRREVSDLISVEVATRRIEPIVNFYRNRSGQ